MPQAKSKAKAAKSLSDAWRRQDIIIKFNDSVNGSDRGKLDAIKWIEHNGLGTFEKLALTSDESLEPLFDSALLARVVPAAKERDATYKPSKLENYFVLRLGPGRCLSDFLEKISCWNDVEEVYPAPRLGPPPGSINQEYLRCAPRGVGLLSPSGPPLTIPGINGDGIQFGDLEEGWGLHPRLPPRGTPFPDAGYNKNAHPDHGRRCVGIVAATAPDPFDPDPYRSFAPNCTIRYYSPWYKPVFGPPICNIAQGILQAFGPGARQLRYGDVLLIELQVVSPTGDCYLPVELSSDVYNMIRLATAYGVIVVEPAGTNVAGNARNIDLYLGGRANSGAFIVGASDEFDNTLPESNYGTRVDFFTPGYAGLTVLGTNPPLFEELTDPGTSWSAAAVAGVVVSTQGMVKAGAADPNYRLGPGVMRNLLATSSPTPCGDPLHPIGVMPNLLSIAARFATIPDVYIRDDYTDDGSPRPVVGTESPDITIRQTPMSEAEKADLLHNYSQPVIYNTRPTLYGRFFNHVPAGSTSGDLHNIQVTFYQTPPSPIKTPSSWTFLGTSAPCLILNPGQHDIVEVAACVPILSAGSIVAVVGANEDPAPSIADLTIGDWLEVVRNNNNIALRVYQLEPAPEALSMAKRSVTKAAPIDTLASGPVRLYAEVGGADRGHNVMDVEIRAVLPANSRLALEAPASVMQRLLGGRPPYVTVTPIENPPPKKATAEGPVDPWLRALVGEREIWTIPLLTQVPNRFKKVNFPEKYRGALRLIVTLPNEPQPRGRLITISQWLEGCAVGSFTFDLTPRSAGPCDDAGDAAAEAAAPLSTSLQTEETVPMARPERTRRGPQTTRRASKKRR